jgi:hypothetical protein
MALFSLGSGSESGGRSRRTAAWTMTTSIYEGEKYDAQKIIVKLDHVYFWGVIFILGVGIILTCRVSYVFFSNYAKLNSVVKSYMSVILPDLFMCFNFWPRDVHNLQVGRLTTGSWCKLSAFVANVAITALNSGAVCVAYATLR